MLKNPTKVVSNIAKMTRGDSKIKALISIKICNLFQKICLLWQKDKYC